MKPRKRIPAISKRKRAKMGRRAEVRAEVFARDGGCVFKDRVYTVYSRDIIPFAFPITCWGDLDCHEIIPRSVWPDGDLVAINCATLCRTHHDWVGDHPSDAYVLGLHSFSWEKPNV